MMTRFKTSRRAQILTLALMVQLGTFSVPAAAETKPSENITISGMQVGAVAAVTTFFARSLSPLPKWEKEIQKLHEDELFVKRWMILNKDDASLAKGERSLEKIQKERKALEKKRARFLKWFSPAVVIGSTGVALLTGWLKGVFS